MNTRIDVPICECVAAARKLSTVFPIPSKYDSRGTGVSSGTSGATGWLLVKCGYCGNDLKAVDFLDYSKPFELHESSGTDHTELDER